MLNFWLLLCNHPLYFNTPRERNARVKISDILPVHRSQVNNDKWLIITIIELPELGSGPAEDDGLVPEVHHRFIRPRALLPHPHPHPCRPAPPVVSRWYHRSLFAGRLRRPTAGLDEEARYFITIVWPALSSSSRVSSILDAWPQTNIEYLRDWIAVSLSLCSALCYSQLYPPRNMADEQNDKIEKNNKIIVEPN